VASFSKESEQRRDFTRGSRASVILHWAILPVSGAIKHTDLG